MTPYISITLWIITTHPHLSPTFCLTSVVYKSCVFQHYFCSTIRTTTHYFVTSLSPIWSDQIHSSGALSKRCLIYLGCLILPLSLKSSLAFTSTTVPTILSLFRVKYSLVSSSKPAHSHTS